MKGSSRMIFQLYTGQAILFLGQLLWRNVQNWKDAVWSLLYECGRREEHRSDICWRFMGAPAHAPIFEGRMAVLSYDHSKAICARGKETLYNIRSFRFLGNNLEGPRCQDFRHREPQESTVSVLPYYQPLSHPLVDGMFPWTGKATLPLPCCPRQSIRRCITRLVWDSTDCCMSKKSVVLACCRMLPKKSMKLCEWDGMDTGSQGGNM